MASDVNGVNTRWQDPGVAVRERYHHGDLRAALVEAAVTAARSGGPEAVRLNQLAATVGVSPSAAYRHFPDGLGELLVAVGDVARRGLAERIALRTGQVDPSAADAVQQRFRASGRAYVEYVVEHPGLFRVACRHEGVRRPDADPFGLLEQCLDDLVTTGALPPDRRPWAPAAAWAAVHGLAVLLTEGPLGRLPATDRDAVVERTLDMVQAGL